MKPIKLKKILQESQEKRHINKQIELLKIADQLTKEFKMVIKKEFGI
jgi:hypothetical protein